MDSIKETKTSSPDVLIAFLLILVMMGFILFTQDLSMFFDREAQIEGYGDYVHEYENVVIEFQPEAITGFYAYLPGKQLQLFYRYGSIFGVHLESDCLEKDDWTGDLSTPPRELDISEQKVERIIELYSKLKPSYVIDQAQETSEFGLAEPIACVYVQDPTGSYILYIGDRDENVDYRFVSLKRNMPELYALQGDYFNLLDKIEMK